MDELIDTTNFVQGTVDSRHLFYFVAILDGVAKGQVRLIEGSTPNTLTVCPDWDVLPVLGDRYVIGNIHWMADTGDLQWGTPTQERVLSAVRAVFNGNPFNQPVDFAVDVDAVDDTANDFRYALGTVRVPVTGGTPPQVALPARRGTTMRLRMAGRIGAGAAFKVGEGKTRVKHLILSGKTFGRAGDT